EQPILRDAPQHPAILETAARVAGTARKPRRVITNVRERVAAVVERLRKVALSFQRGWHAYSSLGLRAKLPLILLAPEKEQFLLLGVKHLRHVNRPADGVPKVIEAEKIALKPVAAVAPVVRVHPFVPVKEIAGPVELATAASGNHADLRTRRAAVLRLIVSSEDLEFRHRVYADRRELVTVIAGIHITDAVERQVVLITSRAVDKYVGQPGVTGNRIAVRINDAGSQAGQ